MELNMPYAVSDLQLFNSKHKGSVASNGLLNIIPFFIPFIIETLKFSKELWFLQVIGRTQVTDTTADG
jgi:hypothetical protein